METRKKILFYIILSYFSEGERKADVEEREERTCDLPHSEGFAKASLSTKHIYITLFQKVCKPFKQYDKININTDQ